MRNLIISSVATALMALTSAHATTVVFEETFDDEAANFGSVLNFTSFTDFNVSQGSVDLIANGDYGITCAGGAGGCIDLDGSTRNQTPASTILSNAVALQAGTEYTLSFDYSGNQRGGAADSFSVFLGTLVDETFSGVLSTDGWSTYSISFVATMDALVQLGFLHEGASDAVGVVLDNVMITSTDAVPLPAALPLFGAAVLGGGAFFRRRKAA